jgi:uncharacterized SAM-binding protein YcdF (DUF218 family)
MPDTLIKIYLYFLIFSSLLFALIQCGVWLVQPKGRRHLFLKRNLVWRNLFSLVSGLVAWYLFYFGLLNNWLVMTCALLLVIVSYFLAEALGKRFGQP